MSSERPAPEAADDESKAGDPAKAKLVKAGVAVGIGSAAIVAALLYANRSKKNDRKS